MTSNYQQFATGRTLCSLKLHWFLLHQLRPQHFHRQAVFYLWQCQLRAVSCGDGADQCQTEAVALDTAIFVATGTGETIKGGVAQVGGEAGAGIGEG